MAIFVTGGAGYVGTSLVRALLQESQAVTVYDLYLYGDDVFETASNKHLLKQVKGDFRDLSKVKASLQGCDTVIHLACISNDPSFELDPQLGKSINLDAFRPFVEECRKNGVKKFIYASSSSVYGIKDCANVSEDMSLEPLTDYSKFKADCEKILLEYQADDFTTCTLRPATVCGYSQRQRLDVIVNILSNLAYHKGEISVFGGKQLRPNIHIKDMVRAYMHVLKQPREKIAGKIYNVGDENQSVEELSETVRSVIGPHVKMVHVPTNDNRSYHISSKKIQEELAFFPEYSIRQAVVDLKEAFEKGWLPNSLTDPKYFNVKTMHSVGLK